MASVAAGYDQCNGQPVGTFVPADRPPKFYQTGTPSADAEATGILLGTLSLLPVGLEVFFVVRGVLYGVVDQGPYDNAWGGPTRAAAWLAHFGIGLLFAAAGLALLWGIAQLHRKLGARWLSGERTGA